MIEEKSRFSASHIAIAFFGGAVAGVVTALLTAPYSGRDARHHIGEFTKRSRDKLAGTSTSLRETFRRNKGNLEKAAEEAYQNIR